MRSRSKLWTQRLTIIVQGRVIYLHTGYLGPWLVQIGTCLEVGVFFGDLIQIDIVSVLSFDCCFHLITEGSSLSNALQDIFTCTDLRGSWTVAATHPFYTHCTSLHYSVIISFDSPSFRHKIPPIFLTLQLHLPKFQGKKCWKLRRPRNNQPIATNANHPKGKITIVFWKTTEIFINISETAVFLSELRTVLKI